MHVPKIQYALTQALVAAVLLSLSHGSVAFAREGTGDMWVVSIPQLSLEPGERVVGFEVTLRAGRVASLPDVPEEWYLSIENTSAEAKVRGNIVVGAAALDKEFFQNFLIIEKREILGFRFQIQMEILTTTDFAKETHISLETKDMLLRKK
jgi:hypothetical protein